MRKMKILLIMFFLNIVLFANVFSETSEYTSIGEKCKIPTEVFKKYYNIEYNVYSKDENIDSSKYYDLIRKINPKYKNEDLDESGAIECQGKNNLKAFYIWDSSITWVDISDGKNVWSTKNQVTGLSKIASFPSVVIGKMEWRMTSAGKLSGIIFRISGSDVDNYEKRLSRLLVIDLKQKEPKFCGLAKSNEEARELLDKGKCDVVLEKNPV